MKTITFLFVLTLVFSACNSDSNKQKVKIDILNSKKHSIKDKLVFCFSDEFKSKLAIDDSSLNVLLEIYKKNNYQLIWHQEVDSVIEISEKGIKINQVVDRALWFGVPENRLNTKTKHDEHPIVKDILLTAKSAWMLQDLRKGFFTKEKTYKKRHLVDQIIIDSLFQLNDSSNFDDFFITHSYRDTNYQYLAKNLYKFCSEYPIDRTTFEIKQMKEDSVHWREKTFQALHLKGYVALKDTSLNSFKSALELFQIHNGLKPDGKVGEHTAIALNESTYSKVLRAALSMDKIRQKEANPEKFIQINLPEYILRYYANDSLKSTHNVVVGKTTNKTPELKSKLHTIMVYPYWTVPFSISSKEILPSVKANKNYISKHHYKIYRGDKEVDPLTVNWNRIKNNTFPYKIVQQPGPHNSLGIIKFEFHNKFDVYVHDTPQKNFFKSYVRSYSHGCMRCEKPVDLGKMILDYDSTRNRRKGNHITPDSLDSLIGLAQNYPIKLIDQVPVFVEYQSVVADEKKITFHLDIYKRDEEYLKIMKE